MDRLRNVLKFLVKNSSDKTNLSLPYLKRILYLIEWKATTTLGRYITEVNWVKDEDGISIKYFDRYINDMRDCFKTNRNPEGLPYLSLLDQKDRFSIDEDDFNIVKEVSNQVNKLSYTDLSAMIFATYPYKYYSSKKIKDIDMLAAAKKWKSML